MRWNLSKMLQMFFFFFLIVLQNLLLYNLCFICKSINSIWNRDEAATSLCICVWVDVEPIEKIKFYQVHSFSPTHTQTTHIFTISFTMHNPPYAFVKINQFVSPILFEQLSSSTSSSSSALSMWTHFLFLLY